MSLRRFLLCIPAVCLFAACDDDDDNNVTDAVVKDGELPSEQEKDGGLEDLLSCLSENYVAWCSEKPDALSEAVESKEYFPLTKGASWRFREQAADMANPPPVTVGSEVTILPAEGENRFVRQTVSYLDLPVGEETVRAVQVMRETFVRKPPENLIGPQIQLASFELIEREAGGDKRKIREIKRVYDPPYTLLGDSWHLGVIDAQMSYDNIKVFQTSWYYGQEAPTDADGQPPIKVNRSAQTETLGMEGQWRQGLYRIDIYDDFTGQLSRSYWLQEGVGPVQWRSHEAQNKTFTLYQSNLEP